MCQATRGRLNESTNRGDTSSTSKLEYIFLLLLFRYYLEVWPRGFFDHFMIIDITGQLPFMDELFCHFS